MSGARALRVLAVLAILLAGGLPFLTRAGPPPERESVIPRSGSCPGCNVVFISLDTLRPDHLEPFGYHRPTSPTLRAFARKALVFDTAYSTSAATAEAHMSLFTSLYPSVHGVETLDDRNRARGLPPGIPTLAALLQERGFATAGFHSGGHVSGELGFDRGFDVYEHNTFMTGLGWKATREWLQRVGDRPFFLFLHTYHVHDPYTPTASQREAFASGYEGPIVSNRGELQRRALLQCRDEPDCSVYRARHRLFWDPVRRDDPEDLAHLSSLYDAEIREVDAVLPRVFAAIDAVPRPTLVVILSDHGEAFGDHGGLMHGSLYEEIVRVPLFVLHPLAPQSAGRRTSEPISLIDVTPTVLDWIGVDPPDTLQGRAMGRALGAGESRDPVIFTEFPAGEMVAVALGGRKLLLNASKTASSAEVLERVREVAVAANLADAFPVRSVELYDLEADPHEARDLGASHPDFEKLLRIALRHIEANASHRERIGAESTPASLSDDVVHQLEALGYLD